MRTELFNNIFAKVKSYLLLPEEATESEVDNALAEAIETKKPELVTGLSAQLTELVQAEATKLNEAYAAQIKTETDLLIGELRTDVKNLEIKLDEALNTKELDSKIENLRTEVGEKLLEIQGKASGTPIEGNEKVIEKHIEAPKASAPVKVFGAKPK